MNPPVDTLRFQLGASPDEDPKKEGPLLIALEEEARTFVESRQWAPPISELLLAYAVGGIFGLYLVRFARPLGGELSGETELWVVVGDLPSIVFETDEARTPAVALQLYCAIAQDWADAILTRRDLSESYPIAAEPTEEHAKMLLNRIEFIRREIIPLAPDA